MIRTILAWFTRKTTANYVNYADPYQYSASAVLNRRIDIEIENRRVHLANGGADYNPLDRVFPRSRNV